MAYDVIGSIAILKSQKSKISDDYQKSKKFLKQGKGNKEKARKLLKENKNIKTVLEKKGKVSGRLRTIKTKHLAGVRTKETLYKENNCLFKFDVEKCYFSPRLAEERKEIAEEIAGKGKNKTGKILVLFAGVAPFSIVIAKKTGNKVVSVEFGKKASSYALENVKLNKLTEKVEVVQGDVKKLKKLIKLEKYDFIVMPRPQLKESFINYIIPFTKKGTVIYYYDFGKQEELGKILSKVKKDFGKTKYKVVEIKKAGEIAPYKFRFRIKILVK